MVRKRTFKWLQWSCNKRCLLCQGSNNSCFVFLFFCCFKDSFKLYQIVSGAKIQVTLDGKGIAWWTDYNVKYRNPSVTPLKNAFNGSNFCPIYCYWLCVPLKLWWRLIVLNEVWAFWQYRVRNKSVAYSAVEGSFTQHQFITRIVVNIAIRNHDW